MINKPTVSVLINKLDWTLPRLLIAAIIFYFYKTAFWPLTYLFILSYVSFLILFLIKAAWKFRIRDFLLDFFIPLVLTAIYIFVAFASNTIFNSIVTKDILLIVILFSLFYFLFWICIVTKIEMPMSYLINFILYITLIICILNLIYVFFSLRISLEILSVLHNPDGHTLAADYNYFSLFVLLGILALSFKIQNEGYKVGNKIYLFYYLIFLINIVLSGSRRGFVVILIILLIYFITSLFKKNKILNIKSPGYFKIIFIFLMSLIAIVTVLFYFLPKNNTNFILSKYSNFLGINDYNYFNKLLWNPENKVSVETATMFNQKSVEIDSKKWRTLDANTSIKKVSTQDGEGVRIQKATREFNAVSIYCKMPAMVYLANHTYLLSFKTKFIRGSINSIKVGWLSDDGNHKSDRTVAWNKKIISIDNGWYEYTVQYTFIDNHIGIILFVSSSKNKANEDAEFIISDFKITDLDYDPDLPDFPIEIYENKKLQSWLNEINPPSNNGVNLVNNGDFKDGLAYWNWNADSVIIDIINVDGENCAFIKRSDGDGINWSLFYAGRNIKFYKNNEYQLSFNLKLIHPQKIPFYAGYWVDEGIGPLINLKLEIDTLKDSWLDIKMNYKFDNDHENLIFPINSQFDNTSFYIKGISLVNLTQPQYQEEPIIHLSGQDVPAHSEKKESTFSDRTYRWLYTVELWKNEYRWYHKLIGHGNDYLKWYGQKFNNNMPDWPHNPFLTVLLYSGVLGLVLYFWLLLKAVKLYLRYKKQYGVAFIGFLVSFFFSFFSGSHPFDPPIMGFFIMLPFLIHSIHKKENENQNTPAS